MKIAVLALALATLSSNALADDHPLLAAPTVLQCLHPEGARYLRVQRLADAWDGAAQYGADSSEVDRIYYSGIITYHPYALDAAVIWRKGMVRLVLLGDTAPLPPNTNCSLLNWNG
ncbi:MAG TPA: hypothetical protein VNF99_14870 [Stellaceae bacterium]|nr:hypothetical protein [Stellaceae bacterium]